MRNLNVLELFTFTVEVKLMRLLYIHIYTYRADKCLNIFNLFNNK